MNSSGFNLNGLVERLTWMNVSKTGAILLGGHMLHIGLWAYTSPRGLCKATGLRLDGRPFLATPSNDRSNSVNIEGTRVEPKSGDKGEDSQMENFWPMLFAPREVGFGLMLLTMSGMGEWRAVGVVVGTVAGLLATTDGLVAGMYGKGGWGEAVKSHGLPGVVLGAMAAVLLRG